MAAPIPAAVPNNDAVFKSAIAIHSLTLALKSPRMSRSSPLLISTKVVPIIEDQCCSVNYFDSGGSLKGFLWFPSQSFSRKHNQEGAATLPASSEHVFDDLV